MKINRGGGLKSRILLRSEVLLCHDLKKMKLRNVRA